MQHVDGLRFKVTSSLFAFWCTNMDFHCIFIISVTTRGQLLLDKHGVNTAEPLEYLFARPISLSTTYFSSQKTSLVSLAQ